MRIVKLLMMSVAVLLVGCNEKAEKTEKQIKTEEVTIKSQELKDGITNTIFINANADDVWSLLREMDNIDEYSSAVDKVEWNGDKGVGGQRICTSSDGKNQFKESIVAFNDQQRTYSYAVTEGIPAKNMVNTFKVVNMGYHRSAIVWTSNYDMFIENPQMDENQFLAFVNQSSKEMIANISKVVQ